MAAEGVESPTAKLREQSRPPAALTVVVVSFNTRELLESCLTALDRAMGAAPDVLTDLVVVDNGSADGSPAMVRAKFPRVDLREPGRNLGFGGANNFALRSIRTPYVLLLNSDTEVRGDAPAALVRFLERHPRAAVAGSRLIYPDGSFQESCFAFPNLAMSFLDFVPINHRLTRSRLNGRYPRSRQDRPFRIDHPLGACMAIRRAALVQVGLFDEDFFMYCEEVDLCRRIKSAGWEIWYTPDALVVHHGGATTRMFRGEMLVELHRSRYRFFAKHYSPLFGRLARLAVGLGVVAEAARTASSRLIGRMAADEWRERRATYTRLLAL